jgi:hypothetical protein
MVAFVGLARSANGDMGIMQGHGQDVGRVVMSRVVIRAILLESLNWTRHWNYIWPTTIGKTLYVLCIGLIEQPYYCATGYHSCNRLLLLEPLYLLLTVV